MTVVKELIDRSNRLGSMPHVTNFGGGNTSAKGTGVDPLTGGGVELMWVKGSGGDLGTLTEAGLAVLRLDRLRALRNDDGLEYCLHGRGGAPPSIDTAMHALVDAPHVDHLHPDAGIALACSADGEALTRECFGDRVLWVPWQRPGFELGRDIGALHAANPQAIGVVLGGHGITAWGSSSAECEARSLEIIEGAQRFIDSRGKADPFGPVAYAREHDPLELAPILRGLMSTHLIGQFNDSPEVVDFVSRQALPRLAALGTSCPDHFLRTRVRPLVLDGDPADCFAQYRASYEEYYERHATLDSPPMRGSDPTVILVPGLGMFTFGRTLHEARITGAFYVNAINAMRGAEAISTYAPISEAEKFRIEYWELEEAKLRRMPKPKPLAGKVALVTGAASGIGLATAQRLEAEGACVVSADLSAGVDVTDEASVISCIADAVRSFGGLDIVINSAGLSLSKPLLETSIEDWDRQHDVMARGSFLVSREAARVMMAQGLGGDIVYIVSKNSVFAGPDNVAYGAAKADQAHQVRLLAAELGPHGIRVNGINPDGVVRGSGIFASGWGAARAAVYGVAEENLGEFYARRTLLGREVLPTHVAAAVFVLVGGDLGLTTGLHIPVDGGVAAAFLR